MSVVAATYRIVGDQLEVVEDAPIPLGASYRGDPRTTSLRREGMLATFKPRTDIHLDAVARPLGGKPSVEWPVRAQVGDISKDVLARGPHAWEHHFGRWSLGDPKPTTEVPLIHERAFGGTWVIDGEMVREPRNPLGTGFLPRGAPTDVPVPAPQVVALDEPEHRPGHQYEPQGLNPRGPSFAPRLAYAGTFDEAWERERWPLLPRDFDYAFYNSAHPDLVHPNYLKGDEAVILIGLSERGVVRFRLPAEQVWIRASIGRAVRPIPARLDTLRLDAVSLEVKDWRVQLSWRSCIQLREPLSRIDVRTTRRSDG